MKSLQLFLEKHSPEMEVMLRAIIYLLTLIFLSIVIAPFLMNLAQGGLDPIGVSPESNPQKLLEADVVFEGTLTAEIIPSRIELLYSLSGLRDSFYEERIFLFKVRHVMKGDVNEIATICLPFNYERPMMFGSYYFNFGDTYIVYANQNDYDDGLVCHGKLTAGGADIVPSDDTRIKEIGGGSIVQPPSDIVFFFWMILDYIQVQYIVLVKLLVFIFLFTTSFILRERSRTTIRTIGTRMHYAFVQGMLIFPICSVILHDYFIIFSQYMNEFSRENEYGTPFWPLVIIALWVVYWVWHIRKIRLLEGILIAQLLFGLFFFVTTHMIHTYDMDWSILFQMTESVQHMLQFLVHFILDIITIPSQALIYILCVFLFGFLGGLIGLLWSGCMSIIWYVPYAYGAQLYRKWKVTDNKLLK